MRSTRALPHPRSSQLRLTHMLLLLLHRPEDTGQPRE